MKPEIKWHKGDEKNDLAPLFLTRCMRQYIILGTGFAQFLTQ
jgi:hypothetical protein